MTATRQTREIHVPFSVEGTEACRETREIDLNEFKLETKAMAKIGEALTLLTSIDGFIGASVVDANSGMMLAAEGGGSGLNMEVAAAGNTEVVRAKRKTMAALKIQDTIEDILITLGSQYHLIRPLAKKDGLFAYLVLDKAKSNLAMARHQLAEAEKSMIF